MPSTGVLIILLLPLLNAAPVSLEDASEYLHRYGYIQPGRLMTSDGSETATDDPETLQRKAIKSVQQRMGIEETGVLDEETLESMGKPRCGVPDVASLTAGKYTSPKWRKHNLTYSIENFSSSMSESDTRNAIKSAFAQYSAVTKLEFKEVARGTGDIKLLFGAKDHGCFFPFLAKDLGHALPPQSGAVHFAYMNWTVMNSTRHPSSHFDFLTAAIHEIGHALGHMSHSRDKNSIMYAQYGQPVNEAGKYVAPKLDAGVIKIMQGMYGEGAPTVVNRGSSNASCANNVYAASSFTATLIMLFPDQGKRLLWINGYTRGVIQNIAVSELFSQGPSQVTAAYYDQKHSRIMLFLRNQVWAYEFDKLKNKVRFVAGYPKRLPVGDDWQTGGAFPFVPERELVNYKKLIATYDEESNSMLVKGHISEVHKNMPENAAGFAKFPDGNWYGFTDSRVFKYDFEEETTSYLGNINDFVIC